mmetsp:Transcript_33683/g.54842  ORF Transcript_33683/g.54842 Transcript_33683/m.54842 type:complete len:294 (-) Transcript_33683:349-1230(-)
MLLQKRICSVIQHHPCVLGLVINPCVQHLVALILALVLVFFQTLHRAQSSSRHPIHRTTHIHDVCTVYHRSLHLSSNHRLHRPLHHRLLRWHLHHRLSLPEWCLPGQHRSLHLCLRHLHHRLLRWHLHHGSHLSLHHRSDHGLHHGSLHLSLLQWSNQRLRLIWWWWWCERLLSTSMLKPAVRSHTSCQPSCVPLSKKLPTILLRNLHNTTSMPVPSLLHARCKPLIRRSGVRKRSSGKRSGSACGRQQSRHPPAWPVVRHQHVIVMVMVLVLVMVMVIIIVVVICKRHCRFE